MELRTFDGDSVSLMQREMDQLRHHFAGLMDAAESFQQPSFQIAGITVERGPDGESVRIMRASAAIDLLLTYGRLPTGRLIGRITVMLAKHPLEREPVHLGWFSVDQIGQADFTVEGIHRDAVDLHQYGRLFIMNMIERLITHVPAES